MTTTISNSILEVIIDYHGAEMKSAVKGGREYMWDGDPRYWGRTSPVLFPFVGAVRNGTYRHMGREYQMGQHGFARDMDFELAEARKDAASFLLRETEDTLKSYPFHFELEVSYRLDGDAVEVEWKVRNAGNDGTMYFSIGAHPAFRCPMGEDGTLKGCYLRFRDGKPLTVRKFGDGLVQDGYYDIKPDPDGCLPLDGHTFDNGALVIEGKQVDKVSLAGPGRKEFVTIEFTAPVLGIWSPEGKDAPFVCLEPWYGRADAVDFEGELSKREYGQGIGPGSEFVGEYRIRFT